MIGFRLFGMPVSIHPLFWVLALVFAANTLNWSYMVIGALVVLAGILAHELGHAFAGRGYGLRPRIELYAIGGLTHWDAGRELTPWRSIWVSFAGPLVGIVIGGIALAILLLVPVGSPTVGFLLNAIVFVNLGWGIFNLLPILPLDGGNIAASFVERYWGYDARTWIRWLSVVLALLLIAPALLMQSVFLVVILVFIAFSNWRALRESGAVQHAQRWFSGRSRATKAKPARRANPLQVVRGAKDEQDPPTHLN